MPDPAAEIRMTDTRTDRPRVSASVICFNEEDHIDDCLASLAWCDEVVVVDSGSRDRTVEIARRHTPHVHHHDWPGYVAQKNHALERASGDWIVCLDADERCTPELKEAILRATASAPESVSGFEVKRHVWYLGRWINHGGWYPDWKLRIVRRGRARWGGMDPHDRLVADGEVRRIDAEILHFTYRNFRQQIQTVNRFSDVISEEWHRGGRRFSLSRALLHPAVKFLECYVAKRGFLDGWPGFVIAVASSFHMFARYVKLREKTQPR